VLGFDEFVDNYRRFTVNFLRFTSSPTLIERSLSFYSMHRVSLSSPGLELTTLENDKTGGAAKNNSLKILINLFEQ